MARHGPRCPATVDPDVRRVRSGEVFARSSRVCRTLVTVTHRIPSPARWLTACAVPLVLAAGCAGQAAEPGSDWSQECQDATVRATAEAVQLLQGIDTGRMSPAGSATFQSLPRVCNEDAGEAYSQVVVQAYEQFEPTTPTGDVVRQNWARSACGPSALVPSRDMTAEARALCTG